MVAFVAGSDPSPPLALARDRLFVERPSRKREESVNPPTNAAGVPFCS